jgi:hypothetical protein
MPLRLGFHVTVSGSLPHRSLPTDVA